MWKEAKTTQNDKNSHNWTRQQELNDTIAKCEENQYIIELKEMNLINQNSYE